MFQPNIIRIDDPNDPRISAFRDIKERDLVGRDGKFIAEGRVVLNVLLNTRLHEIDALLILENRLGGINDLLPLVPPRVPIFVVSQTVLDGIAGFHLHRGLLAVARKRAELELENFLSALPDDALLVVLSAISNHDSLGGIFRNAAAFEASGIILDELCCDPLYRKAIRVSVGAVLQVPFAKAASLTTVCATMEHAGFQFGALSPRGTAKISDFPKQGKRALVLGAEGSGLPHSFLNKVRSYTIPMSSAFDSLNVATASGIALFHATPYSS